jgi:hypothetical protein
LIGHSQRHTVAPLGRQWDWQSHILLSGSEPQRTNFKMPCICLITGIKSAAELKILLTGQPEASASYQDALAFFVG